MQNALKTEVSKTLINIAVFVKCVKCQKLLLEWQTETMSHYVVAGIFEMQNSPWPHFNSSHVLIYNWRHLKHCLPGVNHTKLPNLLLKLKQLGLRLRCIILLMYLQLLECKFLRFNSFLLILFVTKIAIKEVLSWYVGMISGIELTETTVLP